MIAKPDKAQSKILSYRTISLLPVLSKRFEKFLLKILTPIIEERKLVPVYQFGFKERNKE